MDTIGPVFQLPANSYAWPCDRSEWSKVERVVGVHHHQTHCIFQVELPEGAAGSETIGPLDLRAHLIHVCDGHDVPSRHRQERLAREAIVYFCIATGLLDAGDDSDDDDVPF